MTDRFARIIQHLTERPTETEWIEFKVNNEDPNEIGETISALANSSALLGEQCGYVVWGVRDTDHQLVGTKFDYRLAKIGNEELENWLHHHVQPHVDFRFQQGYVNDRNVVLLTVPAAATSVVRFKDTEHFRVGTYKKKLADYPEKLRELWRKLGSVAFEGGFCRYHLTQPESLALLDIDAYYERLNRRRPMSEDRIVADLKSDALLIEDIAGDYSVTNLAGILFAHDLKQVGLQRKAPRIVWYRDDSRVNAIGESTISRGYAVGWEFALSAIAERLPTEERIGSDGIRRKESIYPVIAIRELFANALIHQDLTVGGTGPMVEIFATRVEISNPGGALIPPDRFIDSHPRSRNEALGQMMRMMGFCEERGSGIDKAVTAIEARQLPPLDIRTGANETKVTLYARRPWNDMSTEQRIEAAFQHAALQAANHGYLTNTSLRERFALPRDKTAVISRLIGLAVERGRIKSVDGPGGRAGSRYVPYYAG